MCMTTIIYIHALCTQLDDIHTYIYIYMLWGAVDCGGCDYGECDYGGFYGGFYGECEYGECDYGGCVSVRVWPMG